MKRKKISRSLILVAVLSMFVINALPIPAHAASITLSPGSGIGGTTATVQGAGFTPGNTIEIDFNFSPVATATALASGTFSASFTVPELAQGTYQIKAVDLTAMVLVAASYFTITQSGTMTLSPAVGSQGAVTNLTGTGFTPGHMLVIRFYHGSTYTVMGWAETSAAGEMSATFTVPEADTGAYMVQAFDWDDQRLAGITSFFITNPVVVASPGHGPVGTEVEIDGDGFGNSEGITLIYEGYERDIQGGDTATDDVGSFDNAIFILPDSTAGDHAITVTGDDSGAGAEAAFTVEPEINLNPASGPGSTQVSVTCAGFGGMSEISVYINSEPVVVGKSDQHGSFTAGFTMPVLASGSHDVRAEDGDGNLGSARFSVIATTMNVAPATGLAGTQVAVTGTGYGGTVSVLYDGIRVASVPADSNGEFTASFWVPADAVGAHTITATDGVNSREGFFTATGAAIGVSSGAVGTQVTASGEGFSGTVTIKYDNVSVATIDVGATGAFSAAFTVPPSTGGRHVIAITDGISTVQEDFIVESQPPPVPDPLTPREGAELDMKMGVISYFDWSDITDPSGVTYTLQIAPGPDFGAVTMEKKGLAASEYTITDDDKVLTPLPEKDTPYYWRVRAIDGASNKGAWSTPATFSVPPPLALPGWVKYALIGLWIVLAGFFVFRQARRAS